MGFLGYVLWLKSVIPAKWETEVGGSWLKAFLGKTP
jgi:hypothetical protein